MLVRAAEPPVRQHSRCRARRPASADARCEVLRGVDRASEGAADANPDLVPIARERAVEDLRGPEQRPRRAPRQPTGGVDQPQQRPRLGLRHERSPHASGRRAGQDRHGQRSRNDVVHGPGRSGTSTWRRTVRRAGPESRTARRHPHSRSRRPRSRTSTKEPTPSTSTSTGPARRSS